MARNDINMRRNRYGDMIPYDNNIVYLQSDTGDPPSRYINASWVRFHDTQ